MKVKAPGHGSWQLSYGDISEPANKSRFGTAWRSFPLRNICNPKVPQPFIKWMAINWMVNQIFI